MRDGNYGSGKSDSVQPERVPLQIAENYKINDVRWFFRKRYYTTFLTFLGVVINIIMRVNLSIAVVDMSSSKNVTTGNVTYTKEAEFKWTSVEKGVILGSFSWGYFFSPLGGVLSKKFGGATTFGTGVMITSILTMLSPLLIRLNTTVFLLGRALEGVAESCSVSSFIDVFIHWTPPTERSRLVGIAKSGLYFGSAIAYPISGFITYLFGWEVMFITTGGISLLWCLIWYIFVTNDPSTDKFILKKEKIYLSETVISLPCSKVTYSWKSILTSLPVWAYINEQFIAAWVVSFTMYCLPLYVKDVHNVTIDAIGLISFIPNFSSFLALCVASFVTDYVRNKKIMSVSKIHKMFLTIAKILSISILIIMILWMDFKGSIICLSLFRFCYSFSDASYIVLPLDMAPYHASLLVGISTSLSSASYIINPIILGLIVKNHTVTEWNLYFTTLCGCAGWAAVIFCLFGSGKLQPWAIQTENKDGT